MLLTRKRKRILVTHGLESISCLSTSDTIGASDISPCSENHVLFVDDFSTSDGDDGFARASCNFCPSSLVTLQPFFLSNIWWVLPTHQWPFIWHDTDTTRNWSMCAPLDKHSQNSSSAPTGMSQWPLLTKLNKLTFWLHQVLRRLHCRFHHLLWINMSIWDPLLVNQIEALAPLL